ncbi:ABC transporter permease [Jiangella ureilytica]|uniref:ABC transporter permease n=1 Tax=Jiangella ureilytica TaxID=2530374 RepID=A0A4R4RL49_9ACTN|nr:ABC transporter permease [Jiangella ureilytica]TDC50317.1 ABC transporter permease [Jiangella ureilytica]
MSAVAVVAATADGPRVRRGWKLLVGGGLLGLLALFMLVGPLVSGYDPNATDLDARFSGPSAEHWFGTDDLGRDLFTRMAVGGRMTMLIAVGTVALASAIAVPLGLLTGYLGGWVDLAVMRVVDLFFAIPTLLVAIGIVGIFGPSFTTTMLALGLAFWPFYARLVRSAVVGVRDLAYTDAARVIGAGRWRIIRKEIVPALLPLLIVQTTVLLGFAVLDEAGLGFLGLGVQPPDASWGSLLAQSRGFVLSHPWIGVIAGVPILLVVLGINIMADVLRDRLDPQGAST